MTVRRLRSWRHGADTRLASSGSVMVNGVLPQSNDFAAVDGFLKDVAFTLVDGAPDGMMAVDEQGQILLVNRQVEELFGYQRENLIGKPVEMLLPERLHEAHREHRNEFRSAPRTRTMGAGMPLQGRRADGAMFPVEISLSPWQTEAGPRVIAAIRDISVRVAAESDAAQVRRILDDIRDAVLMFERDTLRFTYVNDGAVAQLGYTSDELLLMGPLHITPLFSEGEYRALIDDLSPGQSHSYTTVHRRSDGTDIPVEAVLQYPAHEFGASSEWMVSIARDLTERLEIERRAMAAERELTLLEDRDRIARDLHDGVIQRLFAAGLGIEAIRGQVGDPSVSDRLSHVVDGLDETIRELRSSIFHLAVTSSAASRPTVINDVQR